MAREVTKAICHDVLWAHRSYGWRAEVEARFGKRRIDVLAISHGGRRVIGFEIKSNYADFRAELNNPNKTKAVLQFCTEFYFVTPVDLVSPDEIPDGCGLIYHYEGPSGPLWPLSVRKRSAGGEWWLPFEESRLIDEFHKGNEWEQYAEAQTHDEANIPKWMLPRYVRPLRFQFDVDAIAEQMVSAYLPEIDLAAGMEAF